MNLPFIIDLKGKTVVITGGGGILCSDFAVALADCGAKVAVLDINLDAAQKVADNINLNGGTASAFKTDVLNKDSLETARTEIEKQFGLCDILINGAGGNSPKCTTTKEYLDEEDVLLPDNTDITTFFNLLPENFRFVFDINFTGMFLTTQVFAKNMTNRKANIINISSMNSFKPLTKIPAYSAAKAAVSNFTMWLAVHFSKVGIRVNAIAPGFFVTNQNRAMLFNADSKPTPRTDKILSQTPMGRFGESSELLGTLLWLCSEEASSFVNGVVIPVDGGFSAYSGV